MKKENKLIFPKNIYNMGDIILVNGKYHRVIQAMECVNVVVQLSWFEIIRHKIRNMFRKFK